VQNHIPGLTSAVIIRSDAPWLPESLRDRPDDVEIRFRFSEGERRIYKRKRFKGKPSEWVEKNVVVTYGPYDGGKFDFSVSPYTPGVLDACFFRSVQEISVCSAPQVLKTTLALLFLAYAAAVDPGPALVVYPDKITAGDNNRDRIQPMFTRSPALKPLLTGYDDDMSSIRVKLVSMIIYMAWAGSKIATANKSIRYLINDEKDLSRVGSADEADDRTNSYRYNKKILNLSTTEYEAGPIWQDLTVRAEVIFEFWVRCPKCLTLQVMHFGTKDSPSGIKWPEDERDPERIKNHDLAWYQCGCGAKWDSHMRDKAVQMGEWRAKEDGRELFAYLEAYRPVHIGFHLPSWVSSFITLGKVAAAFLAGAKDKLKLKHFTNKHAAEPWLEYHQETKVDRIMALKDDRPWGRVPGNNQVATLVYGADSQDDGFYYTIMAVGWGQIQPLWKVRSGFVTSKEALARVLWEDQYLDAAGTPYLVQFGLIDSQGHRTKEVYDFCLDHRGQILPANGQQRMRQPYTYTNLEFYPGKKGAIPGGLQLVNVNTTHFKNDLDRRLDVAPADPGAILLDADTDQDYALQLDAEYRDENGIWQQKGSRANHQWDCLNLCLVAIEILAVKVWPIPGQAPVEQQREKKQSQGSQSRRRW
jgi:phage terminase large subunit GpA-like protein